MGNPHDDVLWLLNSSHEEINRGSLNASHKENSLSEGLLTNSLGSIKTATTMPWRNSSYTHDYQDKACLPLFSGVFGYNVDLVPGCAVAVRLGVVFEHTGIYIGKGNVIELLGDGTINKISVQDFIRGAYKKDPSFASIFARTAVDIYVPTCGGKVITFDGAIDRALMLHSHYEKYPIDYDVLNNNCHMMTGFCLSGKNFQHNTDCRFFWGLTKKIMDVIDLESNFLIPNPRTAFCWEASQ